MVRKASRVLTGTHRRVRAFGRMADTLAIDQILTERSIHLCVDMQRLFSKEGPWPTPWMDRTLPVIAEIADRHARETIFTRFIPPARPEDMPGVWQEYYRRWREVTREEFDRRLLDLVPPLARLVPPALVVDKPVYSPFHGWRLPALFAWRLQAMQTIVCAPGSFVWLSGWPDER